MTFSNSFIPAPTIRDALKNTIALNIGGSSPDTLNCALFNNSFVGGTQTDDPAAWNAGSYVKATYEVTGTNWTTGGVALSSPTMTMISSAGVTTTTTYLLGVGINFTASPVSVASTTIAGAYGAIIYDTTITTPTDLPVLAAINFSGGFTTSAGTFAITWGTANSVTSIWYINLS